MSNCISIANKVHVPLLKMKDGEGLVERFRTTPKPKFDSTDTWLSYLRGDGGSIRIKGDMLVMSIAFTTNREMSCFLEGLGKELKEGEKYKVSIAFSDEFDGFSGVFTSIIQLHSNMNMNSYMEQIS